MTKKILFLISESVQEVAQGEDVEMSVEVKGFSNPHVQWMKGFKTLTHNAMRTEITFEDRIATLKLKNVINYDSGIFKCTVSQGGKIYFFYFIHQSNKIIFRSTPLVHKCEDFSPIFLVWGSTRNCTLSQHGETF